MRRLAYYAAVVCLGVVPAAAQQAPAGDAPAAPPAKADVTVNPTPPVDKSVFNLFNPTPTADLRGFATDRPTKSNSPITVDAGHFQYESDLFNYTHSNVGGVSTRTYTAVDPVLKVGLTNNIDFELQFNGYNSIKQSDPNTGATVASFDGAGDLLFRLKVNLFGNEGGPALALIPYIKAPTASRGIGNGSTEGGVIAPFSYPLPYDFTLLLEEEVDVLRNAVNTGHHFSYTQLINLSHPIGKQLTVYGEFFSQLGVDKGNPPVYTFDAAVAWAVTSNLQLDVGTNIGLNQNAPNLQLYAGIAQRF